MDNVLIDDGFMCIERNRTYPNLIEEIDKEYPFQLRARDGIIINEIRKYINKLERTIILIEVDYVDILGYLYRGNKDNRIFEQCYDIYVTLDNLANDLKNVRMSLDNSTGYYMFMKKFESFSLRFANAANRICNEIDNHELMYDCNQGFNDE